MKVRFTLEALQQIEAIRLYIRDTEARLQQDTLFIEFLRTAIGLVSSPTSVTEESCPTHC